MSTTEAAAAAGVRELVPLLFVSDMARSVAFYCQGLGFDLVKKWEPGGKLTWCRVQRAGAALMLQQDCPDEDGPVAGRGRGVVFYFICDDVDALHAEFTSRGVSVAPPTNAHYDMRQIRVPDPDGYDVWFESAVAAA